MIKEVLQRVYKFLVTIDSEEQVETVPIKEYNKVIQALDIKIQSLTEETKTVTEKLNTLQSNYRHDVIAAMHDSCWWFKTLEERSNSIDSFNRSNMTFQDISEILNQIRDQLLHIKGIQRETKLPQKSIAEKRTDSSFIK